MGFALLFRLDDSCLAAHAGERREKVSGEEEALVEPGDGGKGVPGGAGGGGGGGGVGRSRGGPEVIGGGAGGRSDVR